MNKYEETAIKLYKERKNCSYALYNTFKNDFNLDGEIPKPRSIDGICGNVLVAHKLLTDLGKGEYIDQFDRRFLKEFKSLKCFELLKNKSNCINYVGFSANILSELLYK